MAPLCWPPKSEANVRATTQRNNALSTIRYIKESDRADTKVITAVHGGEGQITARRFQFSGSAAPANFLTYDIPPQASEGLHVHDAGGASAYDEYYYIVSGEGEMQFEDEIVPVTAGDHVHAPMGVRHGIRNTAAQGRLKVLLTFIKRA
jgi:mannose-6-phosphate isomerase-like protein (cupin superfamily)